MDLTPGDEGYSADATATPLSFDDALNSIRTAAKAESADSTAPGDEGDEKGKVEADDNSGDDEQLFDKKTDGKDESEDEADKSKDEPDKKSNDDADEKKKADDKTPPDETKKKEGDEEKDAEPKGDRANAHKKLQEKATRLDAIDEKYADLGGAEGLEDFADLARAYKDPAKVDDFVAQIDDLNPAHANAIRTKIFYDCLDVPENQVEAFNDSLIGLSERAGIELKISDLIQTPAELEKIVAYMAHCLGDDRDDFFSEVDRVVSKIELSEGKKTDAKARAAVKEPDKSDQAAPENEIMELVTAMVDYTASILDKKVTPELERRGFTVQKGDPADIKAAKTELTEIIRERAKQLVSNTDLGKEVWADVKALKTAGDKPSARLKNLNARYETAIRTTANDIITKIAPAMRGVKAEAKADEQADDKTKSGSEEIITKDKAASLDGDGKEKVDYRKVKDPFAARLTEVRKAIQ